jgi:N-acetylneuraminate lyase
VEINMMKFLQLGEKKIPTLAGIKYTASSLHEYQRCLNYSNNKFDMLFGTDEMLLPALSVGAKGLVGSTYNFAAPLYKEVMQAFRQGDITSARAKMLFLVEMVNVLLKFPAISAQKAIMKRLGLDLGPCRLPLSSLDHAAQVSLYRQLDDMKFFQTLLVSSGGNGKNTMVA